MRLNVSARCPVVAVNPSCEELLCSFRPGQRIPFLAEMRTPQDPFEAYLTLKKKRRPAALLESARVSGKTGRYSIVCAEPFYVFSGSRRSPKNAFEALRSRLKEHACEDRPGLPPFVGGAIGYAAYEAKNLIEPALSRNARDDMKLPDLHFFFFDEGIVFDHEKGKVFAFTNIRLGRDLKKSFQAAEKKLLCLSARLARKAARPRRDEAELVSDEIAASVSRRQFMDAVLKAKDHIRRGDIYQANLSQRFMFSMVSGAAEAVYRRLRRLNPSSFFGLLDAGDFQIISGSPERLLKLEDRILETRPIAGTRPRGRTAAEDAAASTALILNEKERAEHIMLVDLERNDLGRVSVYGTVQVEELMTLEDYSHVKHIVSSVRGVLREGLDAVDAFKAFFPGGTITGTPKFRCMQIIDELEPVARGAYTGSLGYFSWTGNMDFNIIIRSLVVKRGRAWLHVGAGIVADSVPEREYEETLHKAQAVFAALLGKRRAAAYLRRCSAG